MITTMQTKFEKAYKIIKSRANSNSFIQALSGMAGFPTTLAVDGMVIFTHYGPMLNEIRSIYGQEPLDKSATAPMLCSLSKEILVDMTVDKILGQIPVAGIYFNAICAKTLTWRLGILCTLISSRGVEFSYANLKDEIGAVRSLTSQSDMLHFVTPSYEDFRAFVV
ncbi:MAG: hypothetical protein ACI38A_08145 [Candidatus Ornithomonoglobus sp.]